jgi:hypothetical protein
MTEDASHDAVGIQVRGYDRARGVAIEPEGGDLRVRVDGGEVVIAGNVAGLRDLARWCLVLSTAVAGAHIHLDPGAGLLDESSPLVVERVDSA